MFRKAPHASGMFQERSACLTPVPGQHTDLRRDPAAHVRSAPPPPHPLLLHGRSQAPLPRSTDMTPGSGSASPVRSSSMRTGTAREKSRSGCCEGVRCGGLFRGLQAQITGTEEDPQQIVGQSLLSCLQNPVPYLSRLQRIHLFQRSKLCFSATRRPDCRTTGDAQRTMLGPRAYQYTVHIERGEYRRFSAWILT